MVDRQLLILSSMEYITDLLTQTSSKKAVPPSFEVARLSLEIRGFPSPSHYGFGFGSIVTIYVILYRINSGNVNATMW